MGSNDVFLEQWREATLGPEMGTFCYSNAVITTWNHGSFKRHAFVFPHFFLQ